MAEAPEILACLSSVYLGIILGSRIAFSVVRPVCHARHFRYLKT